MLSCSNLILPLSDPPPQIRFRLDTQRVRSIQAAPRQQMLGGWLPLYTRSRQDQTGPIMP